MHPRKEVIRRSERWNAAAGVPSPGWRAETQTAKRARRTVHRLSRSPFMAGYALVGPENCQKSAGKQYRLAQESRRDQVALAERGHSQRQACELIELPRSILKYRLLRAERDTPALDTMRRIAATYPRWGLSARAHLSAPRRTFHEPRARLSALAERRLAVATPASTTTGSGFTTASLARKGAKCGPTTLCTTPAPTGRSSNV
jgi:hypothetical protein